MAARKKAGRPPKDLTEEQKAQVEALAAYLSVEQVADYFGIGKTTFYSMMQRDPVIAERYKRGKARAIGAVAQGLLQKARNGDTTSAIFYLKTQAGWRETTHLEHTGRDGGPIQTEEVMRDAESFASRIARLSAAKRDAGGDGEPDAGSEGSS